MNRNIYYRGLPEKSYGIYDTVSKCFLIGIEEETPMMAVARLYQKLGAAARDKKYEPRELPLKSWEKKGLVS